MLLKIPPLLERIGAYVCMGIILSIRSLLGPASCRYMVGCTSYALHQLKTTRLHCALWKIFKRVASCNMFYSWICRSRS